VGQQPQLDPEIRQNAPAAVIRPMNVITWDVSLWPSPTSSDVRFSAVSASTADIKRTLMCVAQL
jgi:hypothetical protein